MIANIIKLNAKKEAWRIHHTKNVNTHKDDLRRASEEIAASKMNAMVILKIKNQVWCIFKITTEKTS